MKTETTHGTALDRIIEACRARLARRKRDVPVGLLRRAAETAPPARDFVGALSRDAMNVIAELKKASPSRGVLRSDFQPLALATGFERAGAAALSVLTEEDFFQGSLDHLVTVSKGVALPVLRKDFIMDSWQIWEARAAGADSFLLIVALLDVTALHDLLALGRGLGMEALVEVHSRAELQCALDAGGRVLGVNNRDLRTFDISLETSLALIDSVPDDCIAVSESGLRTAADLRRLRAAGFDAFLIGESLMVEQDPADTLSRLLAATNQNLEAGT